MRPLRVHIDVTHGTATPTQPDPQNYTPQRCPNSNPPQSAAHYYYRPSTFQPKQRDWFTATTLGPAKMCTSALKKDCPRLSPECPPSPVNPRFGSPFIITAPNLSAYTQDKPWAPWRSPALADSPLPPPASSQTHQLPVPEHLSPAQQQQQQQMKALFQELSDIISQGEDDIGYTPLLQHTIETEGLPLRQPYRRQNPAIRREEMTQVQQMLSSSVIRPSNGPCASPVVIVKKKDGSLRFCVDFRQLNATTIKDAHPIPRIDDLLDALHGARWFSTLDLKSGYWQVLIQEQDKEKMAFRTSSGKLFEFNQVPFGLCNTPATFSRLMD